MALRVRVPRIAGSGVQTITCNIITETSTIYNATVTTEAFINTNLVPSGETFYSATVSPGAANINTNLVPSSENIFPLVVFQDDKTILANLLPSTLSFPLLTVTGGIAEIDNSDILDRKIRQIRRKRRQDELDEENVAAQILKARQAGKEPLQPEKRKPLEIKVQQQLLDERSPTEIIESVTTPEFVFSDAQKEEITGLINAYHDQQKAVKKQRQLQALMLLATELDDD